MNSHPSGWKKIIASDGFAQISTTGKKVKTKDCAPIGKYPVVDQGQEKIGGYVDDPKKLISINEPLIVFGDHTRAVKWVDFSFVPGADGTKILQAKPYLLPRFAYYQLRSLEIPNKGYSRHFKFLKELEFSVPPLAEQKVIADKLDTLLAQVENTKARLERIPHILKRFRQSVLAAAVSGRLTEEWREQNAIAPGNTAELDEVIESSFYGPRFSKNDYTTGDSGVPTIRTTDMKNGTIRIAPETPKVEVAREKLDQFKLIPGDLLITRTGSIGVMALFEGDYIAIPSAYLIRFRLKPSVDKRFIYYALTSPDAQQQMGLSSTAITQPNINAKSIRALKVTLPTHEEQTEIVHRVDLLFAHADRIEQQVNNALARVNNLTQSILAKAFRGELTEQWRKDNPELISGENSAEALLERIKAERAAAKPAKKARKRASS
ncbi:restriction endonuclease subunit S [Marinobacter subterrani]|uniref:restriction endonuclease subunit S n=1 Tax=Marinobacter subterrani TaxID=1658765 RepID=UPI0023521A07|nr:restriction endonuclease subunit S [Marinobacter subterrani]